MARKTFNVLFFIKKARLLKNGEAPVCMRITVNGCMWKSHATLTLLATQDLPTFGYNMICLLYTSDAADE